LTGAAIRLLEVVGEDLVHLDEIGSALRLRSDRPGRPLFGRAADSSVDGEERAYLE
jgi:hypothetical protein